MTSLADRTHSALAAGTLDLPAIGEATADRLAALIELAIDDVDLARLAEAHTDAVQILREAGTDAPAGRLLGVWASEHPKMQVTAVEGRGPADPLTLTGTKPFCSGAGIVDEALVTVSTAAGPVLVRVPGEQLGPERIDATGWKVAGLRDARTATVDFEGIVIPADAVIGPPRWYLDRPGFWAGALAPAACWAGAGIGLVRTAIREASDDPHALAHVGAMAADERALRSLFASAGREIDTRAPDTVRWHILALEVRHVVDTLCADIEERFARCLGPRSLAFDEAAADRRQALSIYRRQCHGERDLAALGAAVRRFERPRAGGT